MKDHLLLFDDKCPLCRRCVAHIIAMDAKSKFMFSPLSGRTAKQGLKGKVAYLRRENTILLIENAQRPPSMVWMRGRAVLRCYWLLGNKWIGWMGYIPWIPDLIYRLIAKMRPLLRLEDVPDRFFRSHQDRFLP
jgi:predicted DCC family thiol-disulfide oxidoreductase YuxK